MKTIRLLSAALVGITTLVVVVGLVRANRWSVRQEIDIAAPASLIRPRVDSLQRWQEWLPSLKELDPKARHSWAGPQEGVGSSWSWLGTELGRGKLTVVQSNPNVLVLDGEIESETVNAQSTLTFAATATGTHITWLDEGSLPRPFGSYFKDSVEKQLNDYFGNGLAKLKSVSEAEQVRLVAQQQLIQQRALDALDAGAPADAGTR